MAVENNTQLLQKLKDELIEAYREGKKIGYRATEMLDALTEPDFITILTRFVDHKDNEIPSGFTTLVENKKLNLSIEAIISKSEYSELFAPSIIEKCKKRLKDLGYTE